MSRILSLLKEQVDQSQKGVGRAYYQKCSEAGNLFRLLMVFSPDHSIPPVTGGNIINAMLPAISKNKKKDSKKVFDVLKIEYNKEAVKLKKNEKRKKVSRIKYYNALFSFLLPYVKAASLKKTTIMAFYKTDENVSSQRKTTIKIGRALLANTEAELTQRDITDIKNYIKALKAFDAEQSEETNIATANDDPTISDETTQSPDEKVDEPEEEKTLLQRTVSTEKTNAELSEMITNSEAVLDQVKKMNDDKVPGIKHFLETNETAEALKVKLFSTDAHLTEIYNTLIENVYTKVLTETNNDKGVANFVTKYVSDHLKELNSLGGYLNFINESGGKPHFDFYDVGDNFIVEFGTRISTASVTPHDFLGTIELKPNNNDKFEIRTKDFQVPVAAQGKGVAKEMFRKSLDLYKAADVDQITLEANVDVGGYAWFRYGFIPTSPFEIDKIVDWIYGISNRVVSAVIDENKSTKQGQQTHNSALETYIRKNTFNKNITQPVENLLSLIKEADPSKVRTVIPQLFDACAKEFKSKFSEASSFKEIAEYIAINNFKVKTIKGTKYTISYKALLSIQASNTREELPEGGVRLTPTVPMAGGMYISWEGILDMQDLDNTYAYLDLGKK